MGNLAGQVAFVTAGAQGLGRSIALKLAQAGADLVIAQRNTSIAEAVVGEIRAIGRKAFAVHMDVTDSGSIKSAVDKAIEYFGHVDILVNNAGVREKGLRATTPEVFDRCYEVNLKGAWHVSQQLVPHFQAQQGGKIVNIASIFGRRPNGAIPAYCATKAALISLTQSLAATLGPSNVNVNAVCPGPIKTAKLQEWVKEYVDDPDFLDRYAKEHTQLKRLATPEDIGDAVVFLASPQAKNITGQALNVDCGALMS